MLDFVNFDPERFDSAFISLYSLGYDAFILHVTENGLKKIKWALDSIDYIVYTVYDYGGKFEVRIKPRWLVDDRPPEEKRKFKIWLDYNFMIDIYDSDKVEKISNILACLAEFDSKTLEKLAKLIDKCAKDRDLKYQLFMHIKDLN